MAARRANGGPRWAGAFGDYERRLLRDPQYREARRAQRQLELASGHLDVAEVLQISQETANQLLALLVDREIDYLSSPHPNPTNAEEWRIRRREVEEGNRAEDAAVAALLGESKLPKWKEYQATLQTRHQVYQFRGALAGSAEPLREDQMEPLISSIYTERKRLADEMAE